MLILEKTRNHETAPKNEASELPLEISVCGENFLNSRRHGASEQGIQPLNASAVCWLKRQDCVYTGQLTGVNV